MSGQQIEQGASRAQQYGEGEQGRLFGLIHDVCELERGVTMCDDTPVSWFNPRRHYTPSFRIVNLNRSFSGPDSFRITSFRLDLLDNDIFNMTFPTDETDPLVPYVADIIQSAVDSHQHDHCEAKPLPPAVESFASMQKFRQRHLREV